MELKSKIEQIKTRIDHLFITIEYLERIKFDVSSTQVTKTQYEDIGRIFDTYIELIDVARDLQQIGSLAALKLLKFSENDILNRKEVTIKKVRVEESIPACQAIETLWIYYGDQVDDSDKMWEICEPFMSHLKELRKKEQRGCGS